MNKPAASEVTVKSGQGLHEFFAAAEARVDRWRALHRTTKSLAAPGRADGAKQRDAAIAAFDELAPIETLNGYPGPHIMATIGERLHGGDHVSLARMVQRVSGALIDREERKGKGASDHAPVILDLT